MKNIRFTIIALLLLAGIVPARGEVTFRLLPLKHTDDIDAAVVSAVESKLATAFTRVEALNENPEWALVIEPEIIFDEITQTEGMVREVARVKGDLVLTAKNIFDGHTFATATLPLTASAAGGEAKAMKALATSIKPTAPVFVRFTKQARQRISEYYAENCSSILSQAQTLVSTGRPEAAYSLLAAIEPSLDCYDSASTLMIEIHRLITPDEPTPEQPETVVEEQPLDVTLPEDIVADPVPAVEPAAQPEPEATPDPVPAPAVVQTEPAPAVEASPEWTAKVKSSAPICLKQG